MLLEYITLLFPVNADKNKYNVAQVVLLSVGKDPLHKVASLILYHEFQLH